MAKIKSRQTKHLQNKNGFGKTVFYASLATLFALVATYILVSAPSFDTACTTPDSACGCPVDKSFIGQRNLVIVDTTDNVRRGKYDDVELLIRELGLKNNNGLFNWINNGKKSDMTSIFILSDQAISDARPIAKFCAPPPLISQIFSFKGKEIKRIEQNSARRIRETLQSITSASAASQSTIVEALALTTQSASYWAPGSKLVLVSDLVENSASCGWFEKMNEIPHLRGTPSACQSFARNFQEAIRANSVHKGVSAVAICTLPSRSTKPGLHAFWSDIVKGGVGADILYSCDPTVIEDRHLFLNQSIK